MLKKLYKVALFLTSLSLLSVAGLYLLVTRPIIFAPKAINYDVEVSESRLQEHVVKLSTEFIPRDWENTENLDRTADYIESEFRKYSDEIEIQSYNYEGKTFKNVIAKFGRGEKNLVVVGAHYDAFEELPAADDNASGVAGLIELASLLQKNSINPPIHLVAFTLEEPPFFATELMGSAYHAKSLQEKGIKPSLMISLEMIGYFSDEIDSQDYPSPLLKLAYPSVGNFLCIVGDLGLNSPTKNIKRRYMEVTDLKLRSINAPSILPGIDFSDHRNYWSKGIDAVMITDTAFYRNVNYHTPEDTYDKLNYKIMAEVVKGLHFYLSKI